MKILSTSNRRGMLFITVILATALSLLFTACAPSNLSGSASNSDADITNALEVADNPEHSAAVEAAGAASAEAAHSAANNPDAAKSTTNFAAGANQYWLILLIVAAILVVGGMLWFRRNKSKS
jgi:LPXTG-motif cell wall-anchored protein